MRVRGTGTVLIGLEGRSPPLPFIEVEDGEGEALIALGLAAEVSDEEAAQVDQEEAPAEDQVEETVEESTDETPAEEVEEESSEDQVEEVVEGKVEETVAEGGQEGETREEMIAEALDLVEADGLVKTGDRAGKPKVSAIEAITGLADVTTDEIDAAVAAREAA